jgi:tetratricopeptide (TPR) repeat protein
VEVWFDQSELRGGEAWDAEIRRQIARCDLFLPVISANTEARLEGYFRVEWKLAAQRTHAMAEEKAFLLPLVIDETSDAEAKVPPEFRAVHWMRLRAGEASATFCERVRSLLTGEAISQAADASRTMPGAAAPTTVPPGSPEVQAKLRQMWHLYEKNNDASREDWALAQELGASAVRLENDNAEAWAAYAVVTVTAWYSGHDFSNRHFNDGLCRAERALSLAPTSVNARFAYANCLRMKTATRPDGERMLRELLTQAPADARILRTLGATLRMQGKFDEALAYVDRAIAVQGGAVAAMFGKIAILREMRREREAQVVIDQVLALRPSVYCYLWKAFFQVSECGDLEAARVAMANIPANYLLKDDGAYLASRVWLWRGDYDLSAAALSEVTQDFLLNRFTSDRILTSELRWFLTGQAHALAGRPGAAEMDWGTGLQKIEQRLAAAPSEPSALFWKARLLASRGDRAKAERAIQAFRQLTAASSDSKFAAALVLTPLGRHDEAFELVGDATRDPAVAAKSAMFWRAMLRFDPTFAPLRRAPQFRALCEPVSG